MNAKRIVSKKIGSRETLIKKIVKEIKSGRIKSRGIPKVNPRKAKVFLILFRKRLFVMGLAKTDIEKITGNKVLSLEEVHRIAKKISPRFFSQLRPFHSELHVNPNIENLYQSMVLIKLKKE
jgi:hypothetical protein